MKFDPQKHHRHSIRLKGYDYTLAGAYFVTIVTWQREMLFGEIVDGEMKLNDFGKIVSEKWQWLETQYEYVELGAWVIMPNHHHGILVIHDDRCAARTVSPSGNVTITNTSSVTNAKWTTSHVTSNPTRPCGWRMMRTRIANCRGGSAWQAG